MASVYRSLGNLDENESSFWELRINFALAEVCQKPLRRVAAGLVDMVAQRGANAGTYMLSSYVAIYFQTLDPNFPSSAASCR